MIERTPADDRPLIQMLRIIDFIDCVPGNAPNLDGRPISMITFAHLGELEQPLALSFEDSKLLVTQLLQSLAHHGHEPSGWLLNKYFMREQSDPDDDRDSEEENDEN